MYNETTSSFEVKFWQHTTLWIAPRHHEHGVAHSVHHISYVCLREDAL